ncbi:MAG TPA: LamG-like jellyroll fold domain-containing protein, partial [Nitrospira sp.]|nr:LamG-like jellyroll fold domain-containing protein [Nitrospira sp.]
IAVMSSTTFSATDYPTAVKANSPAGYYRLGETSGTIAASEVNSPTVDGTYTITTGQLNYESGISDSTNGSFYCGTGDFVIAPNNSLFNFGDTFSLEAWYKPTGIFSGQFRVIATKGGTSWQFGTNTLGQVRLIGGPSQSTLVATSTASLTVGVWHHIVVTKSGSTTKIYINGIEGTTAGTNVTFVNNTNGIEIGGSSLQAIDEVAFYPTALSASDVQAHYKAGSVPGAPSNKRAPKLEGTTVVGDQVRCLTGRWLAAPTSFSFQWQSAATSGGTYANITGATSSTYTLTSGESTKYVRCQVTASTVGGTSSAVSSNVLGPVS